MSKTVFRYFFDFMDGQEKWLNLMAEKGYRLKNCGRFIYTFDECRPSEYEYAVEFVGERVYSQAQDYRNYLEGMGFRTFTKAININFSYGKLRWRPNGKGLGQIATSPGTFNKELLILEKKHDGKPFQLHTDRQDQLSAYRTVAQAYAWSVLMIVFLLVMTFLPDVSSVSEPVLWGGRAILLLFLGLFVIPTASYSLLVKRLKEESRTFE